MGLRAISVDTQLCIRAEAGRQFRSMPGQCFGPCHERLDGQMHQVIRRGLRIEQQAACFGGAGENVLFTSQLNDVASRAVQMWLHSPHHLKNIRGDYNFSGIGVWAGKGGMLYFTQLFLKVEEPGGSL